MDFSELEKRSLKIREAYHKLEIANHGSEWSIEEDALAFLTDAALVGRQVMSHEGRWPKANTQQELRHKIGESIWWLAVLCDRMGINMEDATDEFLSKTEKLVNA